MTDEPLATDLLQYVETTRISELHPAFSDAKSRVIAAVITITWPYSLVTKSIAFILAEPDFRLRRDGGQIRAEFHGAAAKAVADSGIGGGDEIRLSLDGAAWERLQPQTRIPGTVTEWQLKFKSRLLLSVLRDQHKDRHIINIDVSDDEPDDDAGSVFPEPLAATGPSSLLSIDSDALSPPSTTLPSKRIASSVIELGEYASPAFVKRARVSYGSLFEGGLDIFADDDKQEQRRRKRPRFSIGNKAWRYSSRSQSPMSEPRSEPEDAAERIPNAVVESPNPSSMRDEGCQTQEMVLSSSATAPELFEPTMKDALASSPVQSVMASNDGNTEQTTRIPSCTSVHASESVRLQDTDHGIRSVVTPPVRPSILRHENASDIIALDPQNVSSAGPSILVNAPPPLHDVLAISPHEHGFGPSGNSPTSPPNELLCGIGLQIDPDLAFDSAILSQDSSNSNLSHGPQQVGRHFFEATDSQHTPWSSVVSDITHAATSMGDEKQHFEVSLRSAVEPAQPSIVVRRHEENDEISETDVHRHFVPFEIDKHQLPLSHSEGREPKRADRTVNSDEDAVAEDVNPARYVDSHDLGQDQGDLGRSRASQFDGQAGHRNVHVSNVNEDGETSNQPAIFQETHTHVHHLSLVGTKGLDLHEDEEEEEEEEEDDEEADDDDVHDDNLDDFSERISDDEEGEMEEVEDFQEDEYSGSDEGRDYDEEEYQEEDVPPSMTANSAPAEPVFISLLSDSDDEEQLRSKSVAEMPRERVHLEAVQQSYHDEGEGEYEEQDEGEEHGEGADDDDDDEEEEEGEEGGEEEEEEEEEDEEGVEEVDQGIASDVDCTIKKQPPEQGLNRDITRLKPRDQVGEAEEVTPDSNGLSQQCESLSRTNDSTRELVHAGSPEDQEETANEPNPGPHLQSIGLRTHRNNTEDALEEPIPDVLDGEGASSDQTGHPNEVSEESAEASIVTSSVARSAEAPGLQPYFQPLGGPSVQRAENLARSSDRSKAEPEEPNADPNVSAAPLVDGEVTASVPGTKQQESEQVPSKVEADSRTDESHDDPPDAHGSPEGDEARLDASAGESSSVIAQARDNEDAKQPPPTLIVTQRHKDELLQADVARGNHEDVREENHGPDEQLMAELLEYSQQRVRQSDKTTDQQSEDGSVSDARPQRAALAAEPEKFPQNASQGLKSDRQGQSPIRPMRSRRNISRETAGATETRPGVSSAAPPNTTTGPTRRKVPDAAPRAKITRGRLGEQEDGRWSTVRSPLSVSRSSEDEGSTASPKRHTESPLQRLKPGVTADAVSEASKSQSSLAVTSSVADDDRISGVKIELLHSLRTDLPEFLPLASLRSSLNKTADFMAVATCAPRPAHRPKKGPRDYMLELVLTDPSMAPSSVSVAQIYRPHQACLPSVQGGDAVLLRGFQVLSLKDRGFGLRACDPSAWAVFERLDEEMLPQIRGPPVEVMDGEFAYVEGLKRWWSLLDEKARGEIERASQKALQIGEKQSS